MIGFGAPNKQGKEECHGAALGAEEVALARKTLGWPHEAFVIPDDIRAAWDARKAGRRAESRWKKRWKAYQAAHPELAAEFERRSAARLPAGFEDEITQGTAAAQAAGQALATRQSSQAVLNALGGLLPELLGGSADLTGSNNTKIKGTTAFTNSNSAGRYLHYGVREFGMGAIMNGIALHGGFIPFGGTFLVFSDYARNSLRMASIIGTGSIFVLTHDSIGLGEDGPTHQPVEHLASLRLIPRMEVWRPCDTAETWVAWAAAIRRRTLPTVLALTRQTLPPQPRDAAQTRCDPTRWLRARRQRRHAAMHTDRERLRSRDCGRGRGAACPPRRRHKGRLDALHQRVRRAGRRLAHRGPAARNWVPGRN